MRTVRLGIVTVAYAGYPGILFDSVLGNTRHDVRWYVHSHSEDPEMEARLAAFCVGNTVDLTLHRWNRGLARSWNDGILQSYTDGCDYTLVVNDDIAFLPGALDQFIEFLANFETFGLGWLYGREGPTSPLAGEVMRQDFACFALGARAFHEIGAFDENFFPAYSEDTDYVVRVRTAGLPIAIDRRILVEHARNHTSQTSPFLRETILGIKQANKAYFEHKWGAPEHGDHDAYTLPWDGRFPLRINWNDRRNPYGVELDRPELLLIEPERPRLCAAPLPDVRALNAFAPVPGWPAPDEGRAVAVIRAIYWAILGREADDGALDTYVPLVRDGDRSTEDLCFILRSSDEYRNRAAEQ